MLVLDLHGGEEDERHEKGDEAERGGGFHGDAAELGFRFFSEAFRFKRSRERA